MPLLCAMLRMLRCTCRDLLGMLRAWNTGTQKELARWHGHTGSVIALVAGTDPGQFWRCAAAPVPVCLHSQLRLRTWPACALRPAAGEELTFAARLVHCGGFHALAARAPAIGTRRWAAMV